VPAGETNLFWVASESRDLSLLKPPDFPDAHKAVREKLRKITRIGFTPEGAERGIMLTDDYNPIEFYDAANRERGRKTLALTMKDL
jgi:hypothetical protein